MDFNGSDIEIDDRLREVKEAENELKWQRIDLNNELLKRCDSLIKHYKNMRQKNLIDFDVKECRYVDNQVEYLRDVVIRVIKFKEEWGHGE